MEPISLDSLVEITEPFKFVKHKPLPMFRPISTIEHGIEYHLAVKHLPTEFSVVLEFGSLKLCSFTMDLFLTANTSDIPVSFINYLVRAFNSAASYYSNYCPLLRPRSYSKRVVNNALVDTINSEIKAWEINQKAQGEPIFIDVLHHFIGLVEYENSTVGVSTDRRSAFPLSASYIQVLVKQLSAVASTLGYNLTVYSGNQSAIDILCVPWLEDASGPIELFDKLVELTGGHTKINTELSWRPHNRMFWIINLGSDTTVNVSITLREHDKRENYSNHKGI